MPYPGQQTQIPGCLVLSPDHKPGNFVLGVVAFITQVVKDQRQVSGGQFRKLARIAGINAGFVLFLVAFQVIRAISIEVKIQ